MFIADRKLLEKYFPYNKWREGQYELAQQVLKSINDNEILLAAYPIGYGKTAAALAGALASNAEKILYLVRTKTQFQAPLREIRLLHKKHGKTVKTTVLRSRQDYCALKFSKKVDYNEFTIICSKLRSEGVCPYSVIYEPLILPPEIEVIDIASARKISWKHEVCPYEVALNSLNNSRLIILPYVYVFSPSLRRNVLQKYGVQLENSVLIIDEAHNLPETISGLWSANLTLSTINEIKREIRSVEQKIGSTNIIGRLSMLSSLLRKNIQAETEIDAETIYSILPSKEEILKIASLVEQKSPYYVSKTRILAEIIDKMETNRESLLVTLKPLGGENVLTITLYDPSKMAAQVFSEVRSAILLSATMPPKEYMKEMLGLSPRKIREIVYPYTWSKNAEIHVVKGLTSQFSERTEKMYRRYAALIHILAGGEGVTLVIAPSYNFLYSIYKYIRLKPVILEKRTTSIEEIEEKTLTLLKDHGRAVIMAAAWGKLVEGVELVRNGKSLISTIIMAGIPIPEPTLRNRKMLEKLAVKLGSRQKAWNLVYAMPAAYKIVQAIGRGIRSQNDRVSVYILDERGEDLLSDYLVKYGFTPKITSLAALLKNLGYA